MKCPKCGGETQTIEIHGKPYDHCEPCHKAWPQRETVTAPPPAPVAAVLGIDPGVKMGLALVRGKDVLSSWSLNWHKPDAWAGLVRVVADAKDAGCQRAVIEILGPTRGEARGRATSWAVMSETAGRAVQECERQGLEVVRLTPGEWRKALGLPASFGEDKDKAAKEYAKRLLGFDAPNPHVAEAALMAMAKGEN